MDKVNLQISQKQAAFIAAEADEVLFGGAAGGGKSYGQLIDALVFAVKYVGSKQLLLRRTYPELEKSLIRTMLEIYPREIYRYTASNHVCFFENGSVLDFGYLDNERDVYKYQSAEYDVIRFDELTHFTEQMYVYLISRCRGANTFPKQIKSSTNPGGIGHNWVKERFVDIGASGTVHKLKDGSRVFIPSFIDDNLFLMSKDPEYKKRLQNLSDRDKKALLEGCWDLTEGVFFGEIKRGLQIISPFDIPNEWNRYFVMDYGLDMLAGYTVAVDPTGWCYVYRELYEGKDSGGQGLIVSSAAERIKELIGSDKIERYFAPPDLWNRQKDTGKSIAELFRRQGILLTRAQNDRIQGWYALKELLKECKNEAGKPASKLRIFSTCINLVRCITSIQVSDNNPNDVATVPHELTHSVDAMRYFAAAHYRPAKKRAQKQIYNFEFERPKKECGRGERIEII